MTNATSLSASPEAAWRDIRELVGPCQTGVSRAAARALAELAARVTALTDAERAEVARRLPEFRKEAREHALRAERRSWEFDERDADDFGAPDDETGALGNGWDQDAMVDPVGVVDGVGGLGEALRVVGAGTLPGAAAVAAWLSRREFSPRWGRPRDPSEIVRVLAARPAAFQADVAARVAGRIRTANDRMAPLALALLRACGGPPPEHDPLVAAWLAAGPVGQDPLTEALLPRIFEAEGAGRVLRDERLTPAPTPWLALIERRLGAGRVSREELIDGCVRRFLRGGDAADLRFFVRLHELLAPSPAQAAAHSRDYLRLLPAAPGTVAELALAQTRRTGPHETAETIEAITALTFRPEAKLARVGLQWLEEELRRPHVHLAGTEDLAPALATAFGHASYEVQRRAARLAVKHAAAFARVAGVLAEAVPLLPPDLGAPVAAVFGGEPAAEEAEEVFLPPPLPEVTEPEPFPGPTLRLGWNVHGWVDGERWLAAFVTQAAGDRTAMRAILSEEFGTAYPQLYEYERWVGADFWMAALAKEVMRPGGDPGVPDPEPVDPWAGAHFSINVIPVQEADEEEQAPEAADDGEEGSEQAFGELPEHVREEIFERLEAVGVSAARVAAMRDGLPVPAPEPGEPAGFRVMIGYSGPRPLFREPEPPDPDVEFRRRNRLPQPRQVSPPHLFLLHRLSEIYRALRDGTLPPVLLATPTLLTGHLDPEVLVDRLETCAATGAEPLAADLCQALLRLPRGSRPDAAARAALLGSNAARQAASWLAGDGLPDPETGVKWGYVENASEHLFEEREPLHFGGQIRLVPVLRAEPTGHDLIDRLLAEPSRWRWDDHGRAMDWWSSILPSHREVVAVNYLPHLLYQWNHPGVHASHLASLAGADGPMGEAYALVVAYFLATGNSQALTVMLRTAARGDLDGEAVGRQLVLLMRRASFEVRPVLAALTELARQGAYAQVWGMLAGLLPGLLPRPGERPTVTHSEAVALAADVARWAGVRGEIPEVSAHAATGRASRFVRECVRLRDQLA